MKAKLTVPYIDALRPPETGRVEIRDTIAPGLVLRITSGGVMTWSLRARTADGRQTRPRLGTYPALSLADARKAATAMLTAVQKGGDPVAEKRAARAARVQAVAAKGATVAARLAEWQAARLADPAAPWSTKYAAEIARTCNQAIIPKLGALQLDTTTREQWTKVITAWRQLVTKPKAVPPGTKRRPAGAPARDGSGAAAFLYRTVSAFLNFAEAHGWIPAPLLPRKGASVIAPPPAARARVLTEAELVAVWKAADREPPKLRAFIRLAILTGAREGEVAEISAGEVDRAAGLWAIPGVRTKNGLGYTLPLSPLALAELGAVWPAEEPAAADRLLGRTALRGFQGFGRLKIRVDAASKVTGWRWHDIRRTVRTGMTRLGVPRDHAEAAINHVSGRTMLERTYDRHDYAPEVLAALARWQGHVAGLVGAGAEVVPLRRPTRNA
ncbi:MULTISPECIES: tyrosine-type recombinase/integrase [Roseomonadaceae]|uniref:Integrase arm-type DNA-binding domain-containing protein n=1 Tax=Falsiroseomonas oleicola TaxID=2801474 RepID=A0ABS6H9D0_9PROT|nr:integrase arm-type DNA-binding domain-containing protein [Roseomonas oleicola]MBU8544313.1 integrase arm-type DNA-binding domain-containing protein [Roseomonas oleicola]